LSVYYCIDDYASLPDVDEAAVREMDEDMTRKADLVFVASVTLLEPKRRLNRETHVSPHGVDVDHFSRARDESTPVPGDIARLAHPIVGFFGLIERWIDLDLIDFLSEQRPHWTFLLIGRIAVSADDWKRRPNVHFLGKRSYAELPSYGKQFDAAIIPYRLTQQVLHANPLKLREYLAMGKPIVSVRTPEIEKYGDLVQIADSREAFLSKLDQVLAHPDLPEDARRRISRIAGESWDGRLRDVLEIVQRRLPGSRSDVEQTLESHTL